MWKNILNIVIPGNGITIHRNECTNTLRQIFLVNQMKKMSIDLMGPFETTKKGNRHILVVQDYLARFLTIEPTVQSESIRTR